MWLLIKFWLGRIIDCWKLLNAELTTSLQMVVTLAQSQTAA